MGHDISQQVKKHKARTLRSIERKSWSLDRSHDISEWIRDYQTRTWYSIDQRHGITHHRLFQLRRESQAAAGAVRTHLPVHHLRPHPTAG